MKDEAPLISIIIVSYNTREDSLRCLKSIAEHGGLDHESIVVDNGSVDHSVDAIRESFPDVTVIEAGENLGFARAVNRGARAARGRYLLLFNPDAILLPGSLEELLSFAERHPSNGLYGGRNLTATGENDLSSCWGAPSLWSLFCFATALSTAFPRSRVFDPESLGRWARDSVREVPVITGSLLLVSRVDWDRLGGMDERFFLYGDDAEFSIRARREGYRPVIVPAATIIHDKGGSTAGTGVKMNMVMAGKATLLFVIWGPISSRIGVLLLQAGAGLRALMETLSKRPASRRTWTAVWRRRRAWRTGYPDALEPLFNISLHPEQDSTR